MKGWVLIGAHGGFIGATESRLPCDVCICVCLERIGHLKTSSFSALR